MTVTFPRLSRAWPTVSPGGIPILGSRKPIVAFELHMHAASTLQTGRQTALGGMGHLLVSLTAQDRVEEVDGSGTCRLPRACGMLKSSLQMRGQRVPDPWEAL